MSPHGEMDGTVYLEDKDQELWLEVLGQVCKRFNWIVHAYCQMGNHYPVPEWLETDWVLAAFAKRKR